MTAVARLARSLDLVLAAVITSVVVKDRDVNRNGVGEFGTIEQLRTAGLTQVPDEDPWYRYVAVVSDDPKRAEKEFLAYAIPKRYGSGTATWWPFATLISGAIVRQTAVPVTVASDETGVIRAKDLGSARPPTREEIRSWPEAQRF